MFLAVSHNNAIDRENLKKTEHENGVLSKIKHPALILWEYVHSGNEDSWHDQSKI
jgi:hypothetical protein